VNTIQEITDYIAKRAKSEPLFGGKLKFIFPEGILLIDGTGTENLISNDDLPADCSLKMDMNTFNKIHDGKTDALVAVLFGKIKLKGDSKLALKIKSLI
jgi:putative sterol carrier protein